MKRNLILALGLMAISGMTYSCSSSQKSSQEEKKAAPIAKAVSLEAAPFVADSAYRYLSEQLAFGTREPGSTGHKKTLDYLKEKLETFGLDVEEQHFMGSDFYNKKLEGTNIIARIHPTAKRRILFMAHWDTRAVADQESDQSKRQQPIMGADDGGSGVAVLLELARVWGSRSLPEEVGLDFVLVDQEDGGGRAGDSAEDNNWCLGSTYWAKMAAKEGYRAEFGILLDMVGAKGARFYLEAYSKAYAARYQRKIWEIARALGHQDYFVEQDGGGVMDDHVPVIMHARIPMVDIINYQPELRKGFGDHWHTQADNLDVISQETLRVVGETVSTVIQAYIDKK